MYGHSYRGKSVKSSGWRAAFSPMLEAMQYDEVHGGVETGQQRMSYSGLPLSTRFASIRQDVC